MQRFLQQLHYYLQHILLCSSLRSSRLRARARGRAPPPPPPSSTHCQPDRGGEARAQSRGQQGRACRATGSAPPYHRGRPTHLNLLRSAPSFSLLNLKIPIIAATLQLHIYLE